ncbi:hypothetical protein Xbud_03015 [Xenorhabdus budapestensis]|uniref:Uncharacterized protein n=1 Tax=Xenorhabdus budapestensis TaxID=290110 RepID=A0A2D0IU99_XENBU|nr:hypothetical protein Xbud_03015 [Xenorhabdus budapestensis]
MSKGLKGKVALVTFLASDSAVYITGQSIITRK